MDCKALFQASTLIGISIGQFGVRLSRLRALRTDRGLALLRLTLPEIIRVILL
jgi:hypothetical protein